MSAMMKEKSAIREGVELESELSRSMRQDIAVEQGSMSQK